MKNHTGRFLVVLALVLGLLPLPASAIVILVPSTTTLSPGQSFDIDVLSDNPAGAGDLISFGFDIDPYGQASGLSLDSIQIGSLFDTDVSSVADVGGVISLGTTPGSTDGQTVTLATLSFTATGSGVQQLLVSGFLSDGPDYGLYFDDYFFDQDVIAQTTITIVPVPAALLLFGSGVLGLAAIARRRVTA